MKLFKYISFASALALSAQANSAIVDGQTDYVINDDSSVTLIFDLVSADINGEGDGLLFTIDELFFEVLVTSNGDFAKQDYPRNGGLGVEPDPDGDNSAGGEALTFSFSDDITLVSISFNGLMSGDGHQEMADGMATVNGISVDTSEFYMTGMGVLPETDLTSSFDVVSDGGFTGYVESITFFVGAPPLGVPEPGTLLLLASGLLGARFLKRCN